MLWRRATQAPPLSPAQPVPGGESVRLAALQAAWRRDRWVARRRIWLRWALWGAQRYLLPVVGVAAIAWGLWFGVRAVMGREETPVPSEPALATDSPVPAQPAATAVASLPINNRLPTDSSASDASGVLLKFEPTLGPLARPKTPVSSPASPEATENFLPPLISENWLHSKEP